MIEFYTQAKFRGQTDLHEQKMVKSWIHSHTPEPKHTLPLRGTVVLKTVQKCRKPIQESKHFLTQTGRVPLKIQDNHGSQEKTKSGCPLYAFILSDSEFFKFTETPFPLHEDTFALLFL